MINRTVFSKTQTDETVWLSERQKRVTASMVGSVIRAGSDEVEKRILERHVGSPASRWIPYACWYGKQQEPIARQHYIEYMKQRGIDVTVYPCGLVCNKDIGSHIAATPDGLVKTNSPEFPLVVLEIKTVLDKSDVPKTLHEIAAGLPGFYLKADKITGDLCVKKTHAYYYQVITQLAVMKLPLAHLAVFQPRRAELIVFEITFDQSTWDIINAKSKAYYERHLAPIVTESASEANYASIAEIMDWA